MKKSFFIFTCFIAFSSMAVDYSQNYYKDLYELMKDNSLASEAIILDRIETDFSDTEEQDILNGGGILVLYEKLNNNRLQAENFRENLQKLYELESSLLQQETRMKFFLSNPLGERKLHSNKLIDSDFAVSDQVLNFQNRISRPLWTQVGLLKSLQYLGDLFFGQSQKKIPITFLKEDFLALSKSPQIWQDGYPSKDAKGSVEQNKTTTTSQGTPANDSSWRSNISQAIETMVKLNSVGLTPEVATTRKFAPTYCKSDGLRGLGDLDVSSISMPGEPKSIPEVFLPQTHVLFSLGESLILDQSSCAHAVPAGSGPISQDLYTSNLEDCQEIDNLKFFQFLDEIKRFSDREIFIKKSKRWNNALDYTNEQFNSLLQKSSMIQDILSQISQKPQC